MISKLHYISQGDSPERHLEHIENACKAGADWVQLRLKNRDEATLLKTAEKAREITQNYHTRLIINDHYKIAKAVKSDGVHLGKTDACPTEAKKHLYSWQIIGGTTNSIEDCKELIEKKVDYIGLGPFRFTQTKSNLSPILGVEGYEKLLRNLNTKMPIIAIGGITLSDVPEILKTGVYGIAVSGAITKVFNQINSFQKLLRTSSSEAKSFEMTSNNIK
ncbi:thiamine phosphate synthase [Gelidibacter sp. F2691]|nr:thiamine phosphate synthase [Gelidibacter sp. F2691]